MEIEVARIIWKKRLGYPALPSTTLRMDQPACLLQQLYIATAVNVLKYVH